MHLRKNFDWQLDLSDKEVVIFIKLLQGKDLDEDETELADHLEKVLPDIRDKQLDTRWSGPRPRLRRPINHNGNGNGNGFSRPPRRDQPVMPPHEAKVTTPVGDNIS